MMTRYLMTAGLALGLAGHCLVEKASAQKLPAPKSKEEVTALQAMLSATDLDAQIAAANTVLEKFADTEFKSMALQIIASDYERKGDFPKAVTYAERSLEADPKNYQAMQVLAVEYASNTKDTDFDKEDKLKKADKYANDTMAAVKTAPKPNPALTDAQWEDEKKNVNSQAYEILGQTAMIRKQFEAAATQFQQSITVGSTPEAATYVRLAMALNQLKKYDDAVAAAEKAMNLPGASPAVKQFAQAQRASAIQMKSKGTPAPAGATTPAAASGPAIVPITPAPTPQQ